MKRNYFVSGSWNCTCDSCSKKIKATEAKQRWDGFLVCPDCFEYRQPQDFVKARQDKISVPFTRPIPTLTFVPEYFTPNTSDLLTTLENISYVAQYYRDITDSVSTTDGLAVSVQTSTSDTVTTSENISTLVYTIVNITDTVSSSDSITTVFNTSTSDSVISTDNISNTITIPINDNIYNNENIINNYTVTVSDTSSTSEGITKQLTMSTTAIDGIVINGGSI